MTTLKEIFDKPVDRPIEGVIKADDEAALKLEIEEYVLTNEVEKRVESFLGAYINYEGANGVWVSGFFGSGKSHLLKMLALLLENREIDGSHALDLFLPKCKDNEILRGDLKRAVAIPSKSILFNIDQKADVISKTQVDALVAVFVKVFDEMCGYYGKHGHIAQFERDLDSRNLYTSFRTAYQEITGKDWRQGREQALLESFNIAKAYAKATGEPEAAAIGILDKYRSQYRVSIEDFAEQVKTFLDGQPPQFRLNFFVDEVGQYIADNVKLMTNLQTIAESLATKCRGRAWIMVTAQEDMNNVVGEMSRQQSNDFSKIQARFAIRMKLTSADVAEVIQKRLLKKNEEGVTLLSDLHHAQSNNFRTLFDFADGAQTYRNFEDRDHFIHSYPFIPYQFALFQSAIQNLSQHDAFEGKHSSVGERSMLGVFQQVAIHVGDRSIGQLAAFDLMFEGIRSALKSNIQRAILQAEKNLESAFGVRVLKALFLVKYVNEFKSTLRNLCVLMLDGFDLDLPRLRGQMEEALNLLEQQSYVQRNGEVYEFLTDDEKDVEEEIKSTEVETSDVASELEKLVFDSVIRTKRIRSDQTGQDFSYSRKLDDRLHGREHELAINVITPFHEHADKEEMHRVDTVYRDELRVLMPADDRLLRDLLMYKRTEKYIRQNTSITQKDAVRHILAVKGSRNQERYADLRDRVQALLGRSRLFVGGSEIEVAGEDALNRITRAFHQLIVKAFPNLRMLRGIAYTENQIAAILRQADGVLYGNDTASLAESEQEVIAFIQSNDRGGVRTTLKTLLEKFERKPYGWDYPALLCNLASLCARGKVEVRSDGNLLEEDELERALRNTHAHGNLVLEPQMEFTAGQVRALKDFYSEFFDGPPPANEAKALGKEASLAFQRMQHELTVLGAQAGEFPFLKALTPALTALKEVAGKPYTWYLTELTRQEDALFELKERCIDPIRKFMGGPQKGIYLDARKLVQEHEPNFAYVDGDEARQVEESLADAECFRGARMQQLKSALDRLQPKLDALLAQELDAARGHLSGLKERLSGMPEFSTLSDDRQSSLHQAFRVAEERIARQKLIAVIRDDLRRFEERDYPGLLNKIATWSKTAATPSDEDYVPGKKDDPSGIGDPLGITCLTERSRCVSTKRA